jgi:hypothetical protein
MKRDLREYARRTNVQLAAGAVILLFGVGLALIYFIYGRGAALIGLLCLLGALVPVLLIFAALYAIDWIVRRARPR